MAHIYEFGYGTCEESCFTQLAHRRKFSQSRFERMVLDCTVKAATIARDENVAEWESIENRKDALERAIKYRLEGREFLYEMSINAVCHMSKARLTYQDLHDKVVELMIADYGFQEITKLRTAYFFGWSDLSVANDWKTYANKFTQRATRLIRKLVLKRSSRYGDDDKASGLRRRSIAKDAQAVYAQDQELCSQYGVKYVPIDHPDAVAARESVASEETNYSFAE